MVRAWTRTEDVPKEDGALRELLVSRQLRGYRIVCLSNKRRKISGMRKECFRKATRQELKAIVEKCGTLEIPEYRIIDNGPYKGRTARTWSRLLSEYTDEKGQKILLGLGENAHLKNGIPLPLGWDRDGDGFRFNVSKTMLSDRILQKRPATVAYEYAVRENPMDQYPDVKRGDVVMITSLDVRFQNKAVYEVLEV